MMPSSIMWFYNEYLACLCTSIIILWILLIIDVEYGWQSYWEYIQFPYDY